MSESYRLTRRGALKVLALITVALATACSSVGEASATPTSTSTSEPTLIPTSTSTDIPKPENTVTPETRFVDGLPAEAQWDFIKSPEELPYEDWEYFTDGRALEDLQTKEENGLLPVPNRDEVEYLNPYAVDLNYKDRDESKMIQSYGFDSAAKLSGGTKYASKDKRSWTLAGAWKSELGGEEFIILAYRWENKDGTSGFQGLFYPRKYEVNSKRVGESPLDLLQKWSGKTGEKMTVPGYFDNEENDGCNRGYANVPGLNTQGICNWYYENPDIVMPKKIYERWYQTGKFTNDIRGDGGDVEEIFPMAPIWLTPIT